MKRQVSDRLLDMRDRQGWKALGYESFGDYGKKSLGYEKAYLTQLADAGEISVQLGYDSEFAIANPIPPEGQLRPLKAVPEAERKAIWEEATRQGWKALGYESFVEYGKKSLGYDKSHIYELADAGEIGLQVGFSAIAENQPKESQLRPLKAVPEEERKAIWEEATRKAEEEHAKLTAQRVEAATQLEPAFGLSA